MHAARECRSNSGVQVASGNLVASCIVLAHASSRLVVQVSRLVKLLANKGRKKQEIVAATGCSISVPATEDWDEDNGVTITFANGDLRKAQQLVMDFLTLK